MRNVIKILIILLFPVFLLSAESKEYAFTVTYDQTVKPSSGPLMNMKAWHKDNLLRIEMKDSGQDIIIIGNNSGAYKYLPAENMAMEVKRNSLNEDYMKYPEKYRNYIKILGARTIGKDIVDGEKCDIYKYLDKLSAAEVTIYLSIRKKLPLKIIISNSSGTTEILFKNIKIGGNIPDMLFQLPAKVKIVDSFAG
jgi:outer membrane lipoprotein-sorting protein